MTKVTNKHDGLLNVAGLDVRPGATVEVDDKAFKTWANGNAAKLWLKNGIVVADAKVAVKDVKGNDTQTERQLLEGRASGLGLAYDAETSDEDLLNAVLEAEQNQTQTERDTLLAEARALGLNPNANTGTEKLKKMIEAKKAE